MFSSSSASAPLPPRPAGTPSPPQQSPPSHAQQRAALSQREPSSVVHDLHQPNSPARLPPRGEGPRKHHVFFFFFLCAQRTPSVCRLSVVESGRARWTAVISVSVVECNVGRHRTFGGLVMRG
ncbi:hypothetical protein FIBSPDRAFT_855112 [Athelia psychrophila]|uniref:Uncharacterized protein n=1 Tax=Athelia psychrophila TaxID=1759441 RepID=A0A166PJ96_9AGAM|nr:hypothetical protein FIBSPDRAFT_855112 [Fibularhizoctonia sp. CBS 109695]